MMLMRVDLPAPFSPNSTWTSPRRTSKSTSSRATTPGNRLVMPAMESSGSSDSAAAARSSLGASVMGTSRRHTARERSAVLPRDRVIGPDQPTDSASPQASQIGLRGLRRIAMVAVPRGDDHAAAQMRVGPRLTQAACARPRDGTPRARRRSAAHHCRRGAGRRSAGSRASPISSCLTAPRAPGKDAGS